MSSSRLKTDMWMKSSYSGNQNECVEVALAQVIGIRDSKDPDGGHLGLPARAFAAFTDTVKTSK